MLVIFRCFLVVIFFQGLSARAEAPSKNVYWDLPLIDSPFNTTADRGFPSMRQSLYATKAFNQSLNYSLELVLDPHQSGWSGFFARLGFVGLAYVAEISPVLGEAWMHEEWHRAVMSRHGVASHNGMYDHHGSLIPVNHETDEDLVRLKEESPADHIRLSEAGMESEHELALAIEKDHFFYNTRTYDIMTLWFAHVGPSAYLNACAGKTADSSTDQQNEADGADVSERDFIGLDCTGWTHDLHHPEESFAARGTHPSGVGINRYKKYSDLSDNEQQYLKMQRDLSFLNFVDPFLFRHEQFQTDAGFSWNANLRHHLTAFGSAEDVNFFAKAGDLQTLAILHNYFNSARYFPGLEIQWLHAGYAPHEFFTDVRLMAWQQPKELMFRATTGRPGGLAGAKIGYTLDRYFAPYAELETKSAGWVAGNVYLDQNTSVRAGFVAEMF